MPSALPEKTFSSGEAWNAAPFFTTACSPFGESRQSETFPSSATSFCAATSKTRRPRRSFPKAGEKSCSISSSPYSSVAPQVT